MNSFLAKCPRHYRNLEECIFIHYSDEGNMVMLSMNSPTRIVIDYQSDDLNETMEYFLNHDFDQSKKYLITSDAATTSTIDFPFPVYNINTFFPSNKSNENIKSLITPDDDCVNRMPLDNPIVKTVLQIITLITIDV
jgi:hypothetical protein